MWNEKRNNVWLNYKVLHSLKRFPAVACNFQMLSSSCLTHRTNKLCVIACKLSVVYVEKNSFTSSYYLRRSTTATPPPTTRMMTSRTEVDQRRRRSPSYLSVSITRNHKSVFTRCVDQREQPDLDLTRFTVLSQHHIARWSDSFKYVSIMTDWESSVTSAETTDGAALQRVFWN